MKTKDHFKKVLFNTLDDGTPIYAEENCFKNPVVAYRVAHAQAIDNFDYYRENQIYMLGKYMHDIWGEAEVFYSEADALEYANQLECTTRTEYGINVIDATDFSFN